MEAGAFDWFVAEHFPGHWSNPTRVNPSISSEVWRHSHTHSYTHSYTHPRTVSSFGGTVCQCRNTIAHPLVVIRYHPQEVDSPLIILRMCCPAAGGRIESEEDLQATSSLHHFLEEGGPLSATADTTLSTLHC